MKHLLRTMLVLAAIAGSTAGVAAAKSGSGDVSCNGTTTDGDALILLGTHAGLAAPRWCYEANGDVSGDGLVDSRDALLIWHYLP